MSHGRFDRELPFPPSGRVTVKGPFNPQDSKVESAKVLFLIVQGDGDDAVVVEGEGTWNRESDKWSGTVDRRGRRPTGGRGRLRPGLARGIAHSVVVKPGKIFNRGRDFDPPMIEALTWCSNFHFVEPGP